MEIRQRWVEAGEQFANLGRMFQARYEGRTHDEVDERMHAAISGAIAAVDEVLVAAGQALQDPAPLRDDAQRALTALHRALLVTFTDSTEEIEAASERLRIGLAELAAWTVDD